MMVCSPISTCAKNVIRLSGRVKSEMSNSFCSVVSEGTSRSCCFYSYPGHLKPKYVNMSDSKALPCPSVSGFQTFQKCYFGSGFTKQSNSLHSLTVKGLVGFRGQQKRSLRISFPCQNTTVMFMVPKPGMLSKNKCNVEQIFWPQGCTSAALISGLLVCYSSFKQAHAEATREKGNKEEYDDPTDVGFSHGKKVFTDYSITGIPGDGRCLFRSLAHGACLRSGKPAPNESLQRELADELRVRVADEFIKRREETEWFVEGDFDSYVSHIRKPHVWGGEPELLMASHVLEMPITVYMYDTDSGGLISIAEYGQEYGKENPIRVLYHGSGHYDALQIPGKNVGKSRL